jgi:glycogen debranching enzyme
VFAAKQAAARLADALDLPERAVALRAEADALRAHFAERFWVDELGSFALALDGDDRACAVRSSNAGHALFGGIATPDHARQVAAELISDSSFSGWGIRTIASTEARYNPMSYHNGSVWPHDNALIADGLARYGHKAAVLRIVEGMFAASQALELNRLPELFCGFPRRPGAGPTIYSMAAAPQAWASGAVFLLLRACLGMTVDALSRELRFDHPVLPDSVDWLRIRGLRVGEESIDFELHRHPEDVGVVVLRRTGGIQVISVK